MNRTTILLAALPLILGAAGNEKNAKTTAAPRPGVNTPGVQIPFASLVSDADIKAPPGNPEWLFFSGSFYAPSNDSILKIDPKTNRTGDPITGLTQPCGGMVNAFGTLWSPQCGNGTLVRIDPKTYKITATIASGVSHVPGAIAASSDSVWLMTDDKTTLSRIDPDQNIVVGDIRLPAGCRSLTVADKSIFVACPARNQVLRINPATNVVDEVIKVGPQPISIAAEDGAVWVLCRKEGKLDRIDTKTNKVVKTVELNVPDVEGSIAFGEGWLWATQKGFPLARIDTKLETVVQQFHGAGGGGTITTSSGALWLSTASGVLKIDPKRVLATISTE